VVLTKDGTLEAVELKKVGDPVVQEVPVPVFR